MSLPSAASLKGKNHPTARAEAGVSVEEGGMVSGGIRKRKTQKERERETMKGLH